MASGSDKLHKDVFPTTTTVEQWHTCLMHLGYLPNTEEAVFLRDKSFVRNVFLCKSHKTRSKHECIVVDIQQPNGTKVHLRIDRHKGQTKVESPPPIHRTVSDIPMPAHASPSSSLSVISPQATSSRSSIATIASDYTNSISPDTSQANDTVCCSPGPYHPPSDTVAQYMEFNPGREPKLMDLLFVVFAVHEYDNSYTILGSQCYWYSISIYEVLKDLVGKDGYREVNWKTGSNSKLGRNPSLKNNAGSGTNSPGDTSFRPSQEDITAADSRLSAESWSSQRPGRNLGISVTKTPKKQDISNLRQTVDALRSNFESTERQRLEEAEAREADKTGREVAESRVVELEEANLRQAAAIEALRAEVERLRTADS